MTELASSPAHWIYLLESQPGWVSKTALSVVHGFFDPKLLLSGLVVEEWTRDRVGVVLKPQAKKLLKKQEATLSDITSAAELCIKLYWNRFLSPESQSFRILSMNWEGNSTAGGPVHIRYGHSEIERDQILFELSRSGSKPLQTSVILLSDQLQRIGSFEFELEFRGHLALPSSES